MTHIDRKKYRRYHTVNWQTWRQSVKVDMLSSTKQSMGDLALLSTKNLMLKYLTIGMHCQDMSSQQIFLNSTIITYALLRHMLSP